jgi:hypothetical protein
MRMQPLVLWLRQTMMTMKTTTKTMLAHLLWRYCLLASAAVVSLCSQRVSLRPPLVTIELGDPGGSLSTHRLCRNWRWMGRDVAGVPGRRGSIQPVAMTRWEA